MESLIKNWSLLSIAEEESSKLSINEFEFGQKCRQHGELLHSYTLKPYSQLCD